MNITFTGKQDKLTASQERKLATQFSKLSKLLEKRGEKVAQVALQTVRHQQHAEVRINFHDQALVGVADATDQYTAIMDAVSKVEKQALKMLSKYRDTKRDTVRKAAEPVLSKPAAAKATTKTAPKAKKEKAGKPARVVSASGARKPMTAEEAMLTMDKGSDYVIFTDTETGRTGVLV
ncbi:MAG TPA: HPF/RaiA family ribosome-associated protein, partial [Bryobacteraceae bacterium]|nr:HPF/RaiA family ribosome-associated protein [Bryobacteraceae bacterium]